MKKISQIVEEIIQQDDVAREAAARGLLNTTAYARSIQSQISEVTLAPVSLGSLAAAVTRCLQDMTPISLPAENGIQQISVQTHLEAITHERSAEVSNLIRSIYKDIQATHQTYITLTQGINEITLIAEESIIEIFREQLTRYPKIYDLTSIIGITVKFDLKYENIPNLFYLLIRKLAFKNINIVEIVSTATELTFIIDKKDMQSALGQLQKGL